MRLPRAAVHRLADPRASLDCAKAKTRAPCSLSASTTAPRASAEVERHSPRKAGGSHVTRRELRRPRARLPQAEKFSWERGTSSYDSTGSRAVADLTAPACARLGCVVGDALAVITPKFRIGQAETRLARLAPHGQRTLPSLDRVWLGRGHV